MKHVFRFSFALLLISLAAAAPYGHRRVRPLIIHRTVPVIQADGQVSGRQFRPEQPFERPDLPNRRPEENRFPVGRPNGGFFPVAGSPGGIQIFPTRPNLAGQVNSIILGRSVTLNSAANVPVSSEVLRPTDVVAGTTREIELETPSAPDNSSVVNEVVETDPPIANLTARAEEEQNGSSTSAAVPAVPDILDTTTSAPAPVTSAPAAATTVPAPTTTVPTAPATTAPAPVTTDPTPETTDPAPATTAPTTPALTTTAHTTPTPATTAPTTAAPATPTTTTPAPAVPTPAARAAPATTTAAPAPTPTTPAPAISNNPSAVPNTVAPGTLLQTALPNMFPMSNAAGMGGASMLNGQTTATGMAMINALSGGFGLTISIGAALTTPFGNFAVGNGQSLASGR